MCKIFFNQKKGKHHYRHNFQKDDALTFSLGQDLRLTLIKRFDRNKKLHESAFIFTSGRDLRNITTR